MDDLQPLERQEPQPQERRHRVRLADVLGPSLGGLEERLLDHVRGVDPAAQPLIQPQRDHPPQSVAMCRQELAPVHVRIPDRRGQIRPVPRDVCSIVRIHDNNDLRQATDLGQKKTREIILRLPGDHRQPIVGERRFRHQRRGRWIIEPASNRPCSPLSISEDCSPVFRGRFRKSLENTAGLQGAGRAKVINRTASTTLAHSMSTKRPMPPQCDVGACHQIRSASTRPLFVVSPIPAVGIEPTRGLPPEDFKSSASAIPPRRQDFDAFEARISQST